jgi:hypothetical protein
MGTCIAIMPALPLCVDIRDLPGLQAGCHAPTASGLERLPEPLRRAGAAMRAAAQARLAAAHSAALIWWQSQRQWLRSWYVKVLAAGALLLGLATATANIWGVHAINANVLPSATVAVSQALDREVGRIRCTCLLAAHTSRPLQAAPATSASRLPNCKGSTLCGTDAGTQLPSCVQVSVGRVRWIAPTGLVGLTPLAAVGPVELGPSASGLERTSVTAPEVVVSVNALQSALQRKVVLSLQAVGTQVGACIMTCCRRVSQLYTCSGCVHHQSLEFLLRWLEIHQQVPDDTGCLRR